jgi:isoleucyl-tRNA synthetase
MLANNEQINWLPEHIKHGRFGNFLETNVDWALSRERYWGTRSTTRRSSSPSSTGIPSASPASRAR